MLRMQLLTDLLRQLNNDGLIDKTNYIEVAQNGNLAINSGSPDPFGEIIAALVKLGLDKAYLIERLEWTVANSSVISYLQVGRPETISIDDRARVEEQLKGYDEA